MQRWAARLNTVGTVTGINPEKNREPVSYSFVSRNGRGGKVPHSVTKELPAAEMTGKTTVTGRMKDGSRRETAVALKTDLEPVLQCGSIGTIRSFRFGKVGYCGAAVFEGMTKLIPFAQRSGMDKVRWKGADARIPRVQAISRGTSTRRAISYSSQGTFSLQPGARGPL